MKNIIETAQNYLANIVKAVATGAAILGAASAADALPTAQAQSANPSAIAPAQQLQDRLNNALYDPSDAHPTIFLGSRHSKVAGDRDTQPGDILWKNAFGVQDVNLRGSYGWRHGDDPTDGAQWDATLSRKLANTALARINFDVNDERIRNVRAGSVKQNEGLTTTTSPGVERQESVDRHTGLFYQRPLGTGGVIMVDLGLVDAKNTYSLAQQARVTGTKTVDVNGQPNTVNVDEVVPMNAREVMTTQQLNTLLTARVFEANKVNELYARIGSRGLLHNERESSQAGQSFDKSSKPFQHNTLALGFDRAFQFLGRNGSAGRPSRAALNFQYDDEKSIADRKSASGFWLVDTGFQQWYLPRVVGIASSETSNNDKMRSAVLSWDTNFMNVYGDFLRQQAELAASVGYEPEQKDRIAAELQRAFLANTQAVYFVFGYDTPKRAHQNVHAQLGVPLGQRVQLLLGGRKDVSSVTQEEAFNHSAGKESLEAALNIQLGQNAFMQGRYEQTRDSNKRQIQNPDGDGSTIYLGLGWRF